MSVEVVPNHIERIEVWNDAHNVIVLVFPSQLSGGVAVSVTYHDRQGNLKDNSIGFTLAPADVGLLGEALVALAAQIKVKGLR